MSSSHQHVVQSVAVSIDREDHPPNEIDKENAPRQRQTNAQRVAGQRILEYVRRCDWLLATVKRCVSVQLQARGPDLFLSVKNATYVNHCIHQEKPP